MSYFSDRNLGVWKTARVPGLELYVRCMEKNSSEECLLNLIFLSDCWSISECCVKGELVDLL